MIQASSPAAATLRAAEKCKEAAPSVCEAAEPEEVEEEPVEDAPEPDVRVPEPLAATELVLNDELNMRTEGRGGKVSLTNHTPNRTRRQRGTPPTLRKRRCRP